MNESSLQFDGRTIRQLCRWLEFFPPVLPLVGLVIYLVAVAGLPGLGGGIIALAGVVSILVTGLITGTRRRADREQIEASLTSLGAEHLTHATTDGIEASLAAMNRWPDLQHRQRFVSTLLWLAPMPVYWQLFGVAGALDSAVLGSFLLVALSAAVFSAGIQYFTSRMLLRKVAVRLGQRLPDRVMGSRPHVGYSTVSVMAFSIVLPVAMSVLLALDHASHQLRISAEAEALRWCEVALANVADADPELTTVQRIGVHSAMQAHWPFPVRVVSVSESVLDRAHPSSFSKSFLSGLDDALNRSRSNGQIVSIGAAEIGSFSRLSPKTLLVATVARKDLPLGASMGSAVAPVFLIAMLVASVLWALIVCRDLQQALARIRVQADQLAATDLRACPIEETQPELAGIAKSLIHTRLALRQNVLRTRESLGRMEATLESSRSTSARLSGESADQTQRLSKVSELVGAVGERVGKLRESTTAMNESVDESSSSVAELGAASGELRQTASVLSSQVDEVSGSMEHMVQNVSKVGEVADRLAGASEDTSSSMEEMASAMRMIDTSAESMAGLSRDVVEKAEIGQEKVRQTIVGMEAIRDATDAAEQVIRGLGASTTEIGGILDVIEDVADETNLLALNAAIIAAQAGEHGKAFSVVADQIKELADRVLASTKEIDGLIRAVQGESENAIGAITVGSESVMSGVDLSAEAGRTLEEITEASRETGSRIAEIVASVREQTTAASHVVSLMERVRDSADKIHEASDEQRLSNEVIYRSALTMREVAQQVQRTTDEQAGGFVRIRESIEGGRSESEAIGHALGEQSNACVEVSAFLEEAFEGTRTQVQVSESLDDATRELLQQFNALRDEVKNFLID